MHDACLQSKPLKNVDSLIRDSCMKAYGVKYKSHLLYLTSENCFPVEKCDNLIKQRGDYLRQCFEFFLVAITRAKLYFILLSEMPRKLMIFAVYSDLLMFSVKVTFLQMKSKAACMRCWKNLELSVIDGTLLLAY